MMALGRAVDQAFIDIMVGKRLDGNADIVSTETMLEAYRGFATPGDNSRVVGKTRESSRACSKLLCHAGRVAHAYIIYAWQSYCNI